MESAFSDYCLKLKRIVKMKMRGRGISSYAIATKLNAEGIRARYGKQFTTTGIQSAESSQNRQ
jgi:hypothetical protein